MITIIAGSRDVTDYKLVEQAVAECGWPVTKVVSGAAPGVDAMGEEWAGLNFLPLMLMPADWKRLGKGAGHVRNARMAEAAEALIAIWDGHSPGTKNMIDVARKRGLRVYVLNTRLMTGCKSLF